MYKINLPNAQHKQVDGFLFHWVKQNDHAPFLVFIHGAFHGAWCFENYYDYFYERGYNIAAIDMPGRGGMPQGDNFLTIGVNTIANAVIKGINSTDDIGDNRVVIGHSLGALSAGMVASKLDCQGLVVLTPSPPGQLEGAKAYPLADITQPRDIISVDACRKKFWAHIDDEDLIQSQYAQLSPETPCLSNERAGLHNYIPWTPNRCPALAIEAQLEDPITHPAGQDKKVADFYQADYVYMENMGHCLMVGNGWQDGADHITHWLVKNNLG